MTSRENPIPERQDTRRTSPEKLEELRKLTGRMRAAVRRGETGLPIDDEGRAVVMWSERIDRILDGEF